MKKPSVKETIRIAKEYGYKLEVIHIGGVCAYLHASDNFFKSPYPKSFDSRICYEDYVIKMFKDFC